MHLRQLRSRIERLERRTKEGGECRGCIRTAIELANADKDSISTDRPRCPDCGNPHPKIPIWYIDEFFDAHGRRLG